MTSNPITLNPNKHRFFQQIATAQAATAAYIIGHLVQVGAVVSPYPAGQPISQVCYTTPEEIEFEPNEVLGPISLGHWPAEIHLKFHPGNPSTGFPSRSPVQLLMGSLYEQAFVTYFENSRREVKTKHGSFRNWPNALAFARMVRHAFAHGGLVNILDNSSSSWGGITFSRSNNGQPVMYNYLSAGDLTLLMIDMDSQF